MRRATTPILVCASTAVAALGVFVLLKVLERIDSRASATQAARVARRADRAAALAVLNSTRLGKAAFAACKRSQQAIDASNRNGAIIYLVLSRRARARGRVPVQTRVRARALAALPVFQSRVDCERAAADPSYELPTPRPFADLPHWKVRQALRQGR